MIEQLVVKLNEQGKAEATKQAIRWIDGVVFLWYFSGDFRYFSGCSIWKTYIFFVKSW